MIRAVALVSVALYVFCSYQAYCLNVVEDKTGEQQVQDALSKAEKESSLAAKNSHNGNGDENDEKKDTSKDSVNTTGEKQSKLKSDLNQIIAQKVAELTKLREKSEKLNNVDVRGSKRDKDSSKKVNSTNNNISTVPNSAEVKEKENAKFEEESDKKMIDMARKLNRLVMKFRKKMGHLNDHHSKGVEDTLDDEESTVKDVRGKTSQHPVAPSITLASRSVDLAALRNAMGLLHTKSGGLKKYADDSNAKTSYKEDVKLEDRLALEAEEEKKVTDSDAYDDDGAAEAAAGVDKSTTASAASSLSPKEQASQEMQSYNALISSESNRELSQIQEEISKATQSSMGKVSVVGQKEHVQTEAPSIPGFGDDGGLAAALAGNGGGGGGLEGLGGNDPILQGLQGSTDNSLLSTAASSSDISAQQTTSMQDSQGGLPQGLLGEGNDQQISDPAAAAATSTVNAGGQTPIEIGSSTPVDMGLFGGAASLQKGLQSPGENVNQPMGDMQSNFMQGQMQTQEGMDQQQTMQPMQFKKSKISKKQKKKFKRAFKKSTHHGRTLTI